MRKGSVVLKKIYTLTELIVVVLIITILAVIALPFFRRSIELSREKEAKAMLALIGQAEQMYSLESDGLYYACTDTGGCNQALNLDLPDDAATPWEYKVVTNAGNDNFCVEAGHSDGFYFIFNNGDQEAVYSTDPCSVP
ncbi:MAG: type II secretion system protein [Candidatus Omnitrophota bacterium]